MKTTVEAPRKRKGSVRAKVKQLDWIFAWAIRIQPCAICGGSLAEDYDPRYPGKSITLHHSVGHREIDDWDNLEYVAHMVLCHSECHRRYHLTKRHIADGKNADVSKLAEWEKNISEAVERQTNMISLINK